MPTGACFRNAFMLAVRHNLTYVEGFATHLIPVHHAWAVDTLGTVIDPTWDEMTKYKAEWEAREYIGVPFALSYLYEQQIKTQCFGVFYNVRDVIRTDPKDFLDARWARAAIAPTQSHRRQPQ